MVGVRHWRELPSAGADGAYLAVNGHFYELWPIGPDRLLDHAIKIGGALDVCRWANRYLQVFPQRAKNISVIFDYR